MILVPSSVSGVYQKLQRLRRLSWTVFPSDLQDLLSCPIEGHGQVISELVKALSSFSNLECNSSKSILLPDKKQKAKSMIDGGMVQCLASILE